MVFPFILLRKILDHIILKTCWSYRLIADNDAKMKGLDGYSAFDGTTKSNLMHTMLICARTHASFGEGGFANIVAEQVLLCHGVLSSL